MEERTAQKRDKIKNAVQLICAGILLALFLVFSLLNIEYSSDARTNRLIRSALPLIFGVGVVAIALVRMKIKLFSKPQRLLFLLPCFLVAVNNFPFASYFAGESVFLSPTAGQVALFALYCLLVGLFEEGVFRGIVFPILAEKLLHNKRGFLLAFVLSSLLFGLVHLFNLFAGASVGGTFLQVGYSTLIGGLCAFALIQTKNILCCAAVHAVYNFCGLLLDGNLGLGGGIVFTLPTTLMMAVVGVMVGVFVLWKTFTYPEDERKLLYRKFGITEE